MFPLDRALIAHYRGGYKKKGEFHMKKSFLIFTLIMLIAAGMFTGCNVSAHNAASTQVSRS